MACHQHVNKDTEGVECVTKEGDSMTYMSSHSIGPSVNGQFASSAIQSHHPLLCACMQHIFKITMTSWYLIYSICSVDKCVGLLQLLFALTYMKPEQESPQVNGGMHAMASQLSSKCCWPDGWTDVYKWTEMTASSSSLPASWPTHSLDSSAL